MNRRIQQIVMAGVILLAFCLPAQAENAGVIRVHFSNSLDPDLSEISDTYYGSGIVRAHLVIDSIPGDLVTGYHLDCELVSEDASVIAIGRFHPCGTWRLIDSEVGLKGAIEQEAVRTPVSVGYWNLWLKNGNASSGSVELGAVSLPEGEGAVLENGQTQLRAARAYSGTVNGPTVPPTDLFELRNLEELDWREVPECDPVWVLEVRGDTAAVVSNGFVDGAGLRSTDRVFPLDRIQVRKSWADFDEAGSRRFWLQRVYIKVDRDGSIPDPRILWTRQLAASARGDVVTGSVADGLRLVADGEQTRLVDYSDRAVAELSLRIRRGGFFDVPGRVFAVAEHDIEIRSSQVALEKLLVMDYDGRILFEGGWTECDFAGFAMGADHDVLRYWVKDCPSAGEYLLRLDEGIVYPLDKLPRLGRRLSPDGRYALVNNEGVFSLYGISDPSRPVLIWRRRVWASVRDVAVSSGGAFVAFRLSNSVEEHNRVYVLSGSDGEPFASLREEKDRPAEGPLVFVGSYLYAGTHMGVDGATLNTKFVYLFDLESMGE